MSTYNPKQSPPPLPPKDEIVKKPVSTKTKGNNLLIVGLCLIGAAIILGNSYPKSLDSAYNQGYISTALTFKLVCFSIGATLTLMGLKFIGKVKKHQLLFLTGGVFLLITVYVAAFSFGLSSNMDEEGIISQEPLINITKAISLITLIAAMVYFIKGVRIMNEIK